MVYIFIVGVLIYLVIARCRNQAAKQIGSVKVLRSLTKSKFNYQLFRAEEECIICWNKYNESDDIVKLKCNERHFFHSECIEGWIKGGNNSCPMCRAPIDRSVRM
jgi:hypothetical protein